MNGSVRNLLSPQGRTLSTLSTAANSTSKRYLISGPHAAGGIGETGKAAFEKASTGAMHAHPHNLLATTFQGFYARILGARFMRVESLGKQSLIRA